MIIESLFIGVTGWVVMNQLFAVGKIFDFVRIWVNKLTNNLPKELKMKIRYMTYECEGCMSGQIALWYSIFNQNPDWWKYIILSIFFASIIAKIMNNE